MRRAILTAITVAGVGLPAAGGTALAVADDGDRQVRPRAATPRAGAPGFELEIDPDLDARFGPRPVNAVAAAAVVAARFPGARVTEAELDDRDGGPIWEITFALGGAEREVEVDAVTAAILGDDDGTDDSEDRFDDSDDRFDDD